MSNDDSRAHKLFDELLAEEAGTATPAPAPAALPVLPRMRLSPPSSAAPSSVKRKSAAQVPPAAGGRPSCPKY